MRRLAPTVILFFCLVSPVARAASAPDAKDSPQTLELAWPGHLPALVDAALQREDPGPGNWETEALCRAVAGRLRALGDWIENAKSDRRDEVLQSIGESFACDALRPPDPLPAFEDAVFHVQRWSGTPANDDRGPAYRGGEGLSEALRGLRAGLGADARTAFEIDAIEAQGESFTTRVRYEAAGRSPQGATQQRAVWSMRWKGSLEAVQELRLLSIELVDYEEASIEIPGGTLFADATESVLGHLPAREQLLRGVMYWAGRVNSFENLSIFGHAGLALGDVNGDGLEDLYVCAEGGLPNRLYLQAADGTLRDVSAAAGVDWLEPSLSALLVDLDNDGDQDLAVATLPSLLFAENDGEGHFTIRSRFSVSKEAYALTAADFDNDGDLDLYTTTYGGLGPGSDGDPSGATMAPVMQGGVQSGGHAATSAFDPLDDELGDEQDLIVAPAPDEASMGTALPVPYHDANNGGRNVLLSNEGQFRFTDATERSGLEHNNRRFSFAASWEDYDNDGDLDVYVANDFGRNNLYRNREGFFVDVASTAGVEDVGAGMSAAWGDYNRDGWMDLYVGNMFSAEGLRIADQDAFAPGEAAEDREALRRTARGNSLFTARGADGFRDDSETAAVVDGRWAWSSNFADLNNDGWLDLVVANGFLTGDPSDDLRGFFWREVISRTPRTRRQVEAYAAGWDAIVRLVREGRSWNGNERNCAFLNCAGGTRFADVSSVSGLDLADDGRGIALVDWDDDGDLDLWLRNRTAPRLRLMLNQLHRGEGADDFVALHLQGTRCNRDAIGARVEVELQGQPERPLIQTLHAGEGFRAQSSKWLHFGLGREATIKQVRVRWPSGEVERFDGVQPGRRYRLVQGSGRAVEWSPERGVARLRPSPVELPPLPPMSRIVLSRRVPSPVLPYTDFDGRADRLPRGEKPLLLTLWHSGCEPCRRELQAFTEAAERLRGAGLDLVALSLDGLDPQGPSEPAAVRERLQALGFPFDAGMASEELLEKLALLQEGMFGSVPPLAVPLSLLFDGTGQLALIYRGVVDAERLTQDLGLLRLSGKELRAAALPFAGRWYSVYEPIEPYLPSSLALKFRERYPEESVRFLQRALDYHVAHRRSPELSPRQRQRADEQLTETHFGLAELLAAQGRRAEAAEHYRETLRLQPDRVAASIGLGVVYAQQGQLDDAVEQFRRALAHDPDNTRARHNLGLALQGRGLFDEAIAEYRRALEVDPDLAETLYSLGSALYVTGRSAEAVEPLRSALRLDPQALGPLTDLAWILATDPDPGLRDPDAAIRMAQRAAELTGNRDATVLDTLAAAYASAARYPLAVRAAEAALSLAREAREAELAQYIAQRLALYRRGAPYLDLPP